MFYALGGIAWGLALLFGYGGATMSTSAAASNGGLGQVANLQLLDAQIVAFILAAGFGIVGSIFFCTGALIARIKPADER